MKRKLEVWMGVAALAGALAATAGAQSLGEYARQERAKKGPPSATVKEYTNDNLPTSGRLSEASAASAPASSPASASKPEEKSEDRGKLEAEWRARFKEQKDKIAMLEHEIQIRKDELKWRPPSAALQYDKRISEDDQKRRSETADKEKELAAERQKLEDMRDELRRKDLPRSWGD